MTELDYNEASHRYLLLLSSSVTTFYQQSVVQQCVRLLPQRSDIQSHVKWGT